jgi:ABC-type polar amino acid transport system ATPase subunit
MQEAQRLIIVADPRGMQEGKMILKVENLNKSFKGKQVLKNVNFSVNEGEIVAILGQSGAGKTTILRCINNLEQCDSGSIEVAGQYLCRTEGSKSVYPSAEKLREIRKSLGLVFQNFNLFPHMSVLENIIEAPITVFKTPKGEATARAKELLCSMGLEEKEKAYPFELSGGQRQRAAIARACALNPKIMCFDEPTSALDPELTEGVGSVIQDLAATGMSILIITHDMSFARKVAQRIIFMDGGQVLEEGPTEEIFTNPKEERTRNFLGV